MNLIDPAYNWKEAATQEGVDVAAVSQSFMDQSYGLVANKAKILFRDPYRLGFEVVHRNEKATKMTGFFAFRVGKTLLYAPVFFVNGEVKPADMLYRGDVKRFVPLTEEWCERLVKGANQEGGNLVERSRQLQPDSYMHRLAYPQHIKYASADQSEGLTEMLAHAADPGQPLPGRLLDFVVASMDPGVLEKLASLIEDSETTRTWLVDNYDLSALPTEPVKSAAADDETENSLVVSFGIQKSAAAFEQVAQHGYAMIDKRAAHALNVITEVDPDEVKTIATAGQHNVLTADGTPRELWLLEQKNDILSGDGPVSDHPIAPPGNAASDHNLPQVLWDPKTNEMNVSWQKQIFYGQNALQLDSSDKLGKSVGDVNVGDVYLFLHAKSLQCMGPFKVTEVAKDGESCVISIENNYGGRETPLVYSPERTSAHQYISDDFRALPVKTKERKDAVAAGGFEPEWSVALMSPAALKDWMFSAGGIADSTGLSISKDKAGDTFDLKHNKVKRASVNRLEAHAVLAAELNLPAADVGNILDKVERTGHVDCRVWEPKSVEKNAFTTRVSAMAPWMKSFDSNLGVPVDAPQQQVLSTYTPQRRRQTERYGDHFVRDLNGKNDTTDEDTGLPGDAVFTMAPEQLAEMASKYDMPHIFDHGALSTLAESSFNTLDQVRQYIPDLEQGVDRCFRILFLLRYRPADFEEAYGRDELLEMESEISQLAQLSGSNLLRLLKRFDSNTQ